MEIERYKELFIHRDDVFAEQQSSGQYFPVRRPIEDDDIAEHLAGYASYGVYVIEPKSVFDPTKPVHHAQVGVKDTVKYIVWDLDTHDQAHTDALRYLVQTMVQEATDQEVNDSPDGGKWVPSLLMESSGNKGVHVWLFLSAPLPARQVRAWVERDFFPGWRALGYKDLEVFPKQDQVDEGGYGNLVKLPFGVHAVTGKKSEPIVIQGWASGVNEVVPLDAALVPPAPDGATVTQLAASGHGAARAGAGPVSGPSTPFPCIDLALYGPVGSGYRDRMIHRLALYLYGHGMAEDLATEQCLRAASNYDPPLPEREVRAKVKSAYRGRQRGAGCNTQDWLQDICPGPCDQARMTGSPGALHKAQAGSTVSVDVVDRSYTDGKVRLKLSHPDADNSPTLVVSSNDD